MFKKLMVACIPVLALGCSVSNGTSGGLDDTDTEMAKVDGGVTAVGMDEETVHDAPLRYVDIPTFYIDKYEVTNAQYRACVEAQGCSEPKIKGFDLIPDYYDNGDYDKHPVSFVTWTQAADYCAYKGKRLPLELEWEKAARGGDGRMYPWGDATPNCDQAHFGDCNALRAGGAGPLEVGSLEAGVSPYGVYDMAGNMSEWVADYYDSETYYTFEDGALPSRPKAGRTKSVRGGSWWCEDNRLPSFRREATVPWYRAGNIGFRCASSEL